MRKHLMMKLQLFIILTFMTVTIHAQDDGDDFRKEFEQFSTNARKEYNDFRQQVMAEYTEFVRKAWISYDAQPAKPCPEIEKDVTPVTIDRRDNSKPPTETNRFSFKSLIPMIWRKEKEPQPEPVVPVQELPRQTTDYFVFFYFGTKDSVRLDEQCKFQLPSVNENDIADALQLLSNKQYENMLYDCIRIRTSRKLSDWAYLNMIKKMAGDFLGKETNEATLLWAYIYLQSGYKVRLASNKTTNKLYGLIASKQFVYHKPYYIIDGVDYVLFDSDDEFRLTICNVSYPKEAGLSLMIENNQAFDLLSTGERVLKSKQSPVDKHIPNLTVKIKSNKNLIDFYNTYPSSQLGDNFMTRWAMYANTPMERNIKDQLYPELKKYIHGLNQHDAAERLLNFVQTAFTYEYDDVVWGEDRAFFAEETLFYPYSDCEDRAILFSRLVRDLMGLKVILVYYPGHLATAVHFTEEVKGDQIMVNDDAYTVCDPTYDNAYVGDTMPDTEAGFAVKDGKTYRIKMDNANATVILLDNNDQ